jgi:hypothetical protein
MVVRGFSKRKGSLQINGKGAIYTIKYMLKKSPAKEFAGLFLILFNINNG